MIVEKSKNTKAKLSPHLPPLQHISWKLRHGSWRSITSLEMILLEVDAFLVLWDRSPEFTSFVRDRNFDMFIFLVPTCNFDRYSLNMHFVNAKNYAIR